MNRRSFFTSLGSLVAAPAIVPFASLMPIRGIIMSAPKKFDSFTVKYDLADQFISSIEQIGGNFYVRMADKSVYGPYPLGVRVL